MVLFPVDGGGWVFSVGSITYGGALAWNGCDNGLQGMPPAVLRVGIYDTQWHITNNVTVDSTKGQTVIRFPNPKSTGVISVTRMDAGEVMVGYEVS